MEKNIKKDVKAEVKPKVKTPKTKAAVKKPKIIKPADAAESAGLADNKTEVKTKKPMFSWLKKAINGGTEDYAADEDQELAAIFLAEQEKIKQEAELSQGIVSEVEAQESAKIKVKIPKKLPSLDKAMRINPDIKTGLTDAQVLKRMEQGFINENRMRTTKSVGSILLGNIFTFFNLLCFTIAGILFSMGQYKDTLFLAIILINMSISIIQEIKAKLTIQKISLLTAPTALVLRGSKTKEVQVNEVVLDDLMILSLGKQVCADCIIAEGTVEVNESLLTGESVAIKKSVGDPLFSGSFIVSGKCIARVDKVGAYNYSAKLVQKAQVLKKPKSELLRSVKLIVNSIAFVIIPIGILMFFNNKTQTGGDLIETMRRTAGSLIGMIPAGMFLLTSLALAVGVIKLAKKQTLVQDLYSIEMLSRADVLCLDKTGTITDGTMKVNTVMQLASNPDNTIHDIIGSMLTALNDNNQTSQALGAHFGYNKELTPVEIMPFSSSRKLSAVSFNNHMTYTLGAPEFVLKEKNPQVDKMVKSYAQKGFRVLLLSKAAGKIEKEKLPKTQTPIALIIIEDHIRENAAETLKWFQDNGVAVKVISGDNPITVSEVSKRVGVPNAERFISLEGLSKQQVVEAADKYTVFGRVSPEQKSILVKALKNRGHKVAMTGDGVNDILALKEADCSIAMASGSEATRNASHVVLLDSDFAAMPSIVAEGRRVVNNISKSSSLFLMKTFFTMIISILSIATLQKYPFSTNQMLLLEFFVIGFPSAILALQPNKDQVKGTFLTNLIAKAIPGALLFAFGVVSCFVFTKFVIPSNQFITMASLTILFMGLSILFRICKPFDIMRSFLFVFVLLAVVLVLALVPWSFFDYDKLKTVNILFMIVLVQFAYPFYASIMQATDKLFTKRKRD